jgi:hypothetical protein
MQAQFTVGLLSSLSNSNFIERGREYPERVFNTIPKVCSGTIASTTVMTRLVASWIL